MSPAIGNLHLTLANRAADDAERKWRQHKGECPSCTRAARTRHPDEMCGHGTALYKDRRECMAELARERRLAKLPNPDQASLFSEADLQPGGAGDG